MADHNNLNQQSWEVVRNYIRICHLTTNNPSIIVMEPIQTIIHWELCVGTTLQHYNTQASSIQETKKLTLFVQAQYLSNRI